MSEGIRCSNSGCQREVLKALSAHGVCVGHYLDMTSIRLEAALELCQNAQPVDPNAFEWLLSQADFAAHALAKGGGASDALERTRLLELLLCLANLHDYVDHHSIEAVLAAPGTTGVVAS